uniref:Uncharacterized protein n=1 Tax=uncultured marine virus TaxID=186617 RepID=A0A0F7L2T1_9VIRU|nr:hypothetical protein [uncultured marine virus]
MICGEYPGFSFNRDDTKYPDTLSPIFSNLKKLPAVFLFSSENRSFEFVICLLVKK